MVIITSAQPLNSAISCENDSYTTNIPTTTVVTVIRKYLYKCVCAVYTICSYYLRAEFISFRAFVCAATV